MGSNQHKTMTMKRAIKIVIFKEMIMLASSIYF
jgi:hypothetical protein